MDIISEGVELSLVELIILNGMVSGQRLACNNIHNEPEHELVLMDLHMKLTKALLKASKRVPVVPKKPLQKEVKNGEGTL